MNRPARLTAAFASMLTPALTPVLVPVMPPAATAQPTSDQRTQEWLSRNSAELQALDKVNARRARLQVKVGEQVQYGSLTISVQSCQVRPPNQPQGAAAYLVIEDSRPGAPAFRGWMFANAPAASMLEHPIYDVRVIGCRQT